MMIVKRTKAKFKIFFLPLSPLSIGNKLFPKKKIPSATFHCLQLSSPFFLFPSLLSLFFIIYELLEGEEKNLLLISTANDDELDRALHIHNADCFFLIFETLLLNYATVKVKTGWEGCCAISMREQNFPYISIPRLDFPSFVIVVSALNTSSWHMIQQR